MAFPEPVFPCADLKQIAAAASLSEEAWKATADALGNPTAPGDLQFIPPNIWTETLRAVRWKIADADHKLSPIQIGKLCQCQDAIKGLGGPAPPPTVVTATPAADTPTVKLSHVIDENLSGTVQRPSGTDTNT